MKAKRILVVEDQGATALEEVEVIRQLGYEVIGIVMTGEDAIKNVKLEKPDLVLMDINLMGRMDGREAAKKIREISNVPVIYITAYGDKKSASSGNFTVPDGFGYIVKPFTQEELRTEILRLID